MDLQFLIDNLKSTNAPPRGWDGQIAQVIGWKKEIQDIVDPSTGAKKQNVLWVVPSGEDFGKIPYYTTSLADAVSLVEIAAPGHVGAVTWGGGRSTAKIDDDPICEASTPALALCIAALTRKLLIQKYGAKN